MTSDFDTTGLTPELLTKYDRPGPRYTSYPTAPHFTEDFNESVYRGRLAKAAKRSDEALSLYVHIPFCIEHCTYCGCNVVISPKKGPEENYLDALEKELDLLAESLGNRRHLNQLHWGGGTPTYLSPDQCERLFHSITQRFPLLDTAEVALEIDPCVTSMEHLKTLRGLGFNRLSMGVQDTNPEVQAAVQRIQPLELTRSHIEEARRIGFSSINIDLIYGLPKQTEESFRHTVSTVLKDLAPDRVACFSYAHVPWIKPHQKKLDQDQMAQGWEKFRIFVGAAEEFVGSGYRFIGFDHFARPEDELAIALDEGRLHRSFMGYTTMPASDQIGLGVTSIGELSGSYAANERNLARYQRAVNDGHLPVERGVVRTPEDELRGSVIRKIICTLKLDFAWVESAFGIDPRVHFHDAITELEELSNDGLVEVGDNGLRVTGRGRFFLRNICMPFDAYLGKSEGGPKYSRTV